MDTESQDERLGPLPNDEPRITACSKCNKQKPGKRYTHPKDKNAGNVCGSCYRKLRYWGTCSQCGTETNIPYRKGTTCQGCYNHGRPTREKKTRVCGECGEKKATVDRKHPIDDKKGPICSACFIKLTLKEICPGCDEPKVLDRNLSVDGELVRVCGNCQRTANVPKGPCALCSKDKDLWYWLPDGSARICAGCRRLHLNPIGTCIECRNPEALLEYNHPDDPEKGSVCATCY